MECARVKEKLSAYLDGMLDESTLECVEAHLSGCEECQHEASLLRVVVESAGGIGQVEPPSGLKSRIFDAARKAEGCRKVNELLSAYLDAELGPEDADFVRSHVGVCQHCAGELNALRMLAEAAGEIEQVEPPAGLRASIKAAVAEQSTRRTWLPGIRQLLASSAFRWAAGAAAAGTIAVAVLISSPAPDRTTQPVAEVKPQQPMVASRPDVVVPESGPVVVVEPEAAPSIDRVVVNVAKAPGKRPVPVSVEVAESPIEEPVKPPAVKPNAEPPEPRITVADIGPEDLPVVEMVKPEPVKVASAPKPAPVIEAKAKSSARPSLIKVASAPVISHDDTEEWLKKAKTEAAMRGGRGSRGMRIVSANF